MKILNSNHYNKLNNPIGIFDSGIGGLTVLREVERLLPGEDFIYFCDSARLPYGNKSPEIIVNNTLECISFLQTLGIKLLIIACHTASAHVSIGQSIGMIQTTCQLLLNSRQIKRLAILGTQSTIASGVYQNLLQQKLTLFPVACPLFVPLAEEELFDHDLADRAAIHYLQPLQAENIDAVLMACTHYPLLRRSIEKVVGPSLTMIDPAVIVAEEVKRRLAKDNLLNEKQSGEVQFYTTADCKRFSALARSILKRDLPQAVLVNLD